MLRSECGAAAESKEENIRGTKGRPADQRTGGRAERIKDEKGETGRRIYYRNEIPLRRVRSRGRIWTDLDVGPVKRGIRRWRDRVLYRERGKCRVCRVRAQIP